MPKTRATVLVAFATTGGVPMASSVGNVRIVPPQLDGFEALGQVKIVMATNRPDILDPALMRPGRLDRKIEIPLPNDAGRLDILKIHAAPIAKMGDVDWEAVVKLAEGFNGADMRNICTEAGMFAIRADRDYCVEDDFMKAARKTGESKALESKLDYSKV